MAKYNSCPKCGNSEDNTQIMQCKNCDFIGCYVRGTGCWTDKRCPNCGENAGYRILGKVYEKK